MSTSLVATPAVPERFANPLRQIRGAFEQPAVRRSLPMVLMVGLLAAAALAWMLLATPPQRTLFANLSDGDKSAVTQALTQAGIRNRIDDSGAVTVGSDDYAKARMLLASEDLPKAAPVGYDLLDNLPMGESRAVEGERLRQARESELAHSIDAIDAVADAQVHLAMPEQSVFVRDETDPSASVILKLQPGRSLDDDQVASIVNLVASSVPGMKPAAVTIVDQTGTLLTKPAGEDGDTAAGNERIDFQRRVEDKYQQQLAQLLTPLVGAGNFSAQVQADVDLDQVQATRESYDKDGALRAEQGDWTGDQTGQGEPSGIPGALSNTPPPPATVTTGGPAATPPAGAPAASASNAIPNNQKQSDSFTRNYDLGREVSVTQGAPGAVKRLSVAVVLRDPGTGKPRSQADIQQITQLVQAAVGYDPTRHDIVTVISHRFADADAATDTTPWYQAAWVPMVVRNGTALVIAVLVLLLGVRPLAKALLKKREDAAAARPAFAGAGAASPDGAAPMAAGTPVSIDMLEKSRGYDDRVGLVRGFTRDNPARAALAVRDMIRTDAQ